MYFQAVKKAANQKQLILKPKVIMTDFEIAAINSFKKNFQGVENKGCLFHFAQSLYKNICKHGLKTKYDKDETVKDWFKSIFALSLIPLASIDATWNEILIKQPKINGISKFVQYFVNNYFEGKFPMQF